MMKETKYIDEKVFPSIHTTPGPSFAAVPRSNTEQQQPTSVAQA
jgi:hypothetical protein